MPSVILKAHFDGEHIVLDEPFEFPINARLAVTVLSSTESDAEVERVDWSTFGIANLSRAYGNNEPEYSISDVKS
ncbi:MAG: hypothetical protein NT069_20480 [Planctomycetota bacterium]|nr:hypothetical protein [Planctomycetota bacterium]